MKVNDKFFPLLGMARRANRLACGHDAAVSSIKSGDSKLIILSSDSSPRLIKEISKEIDYSHKLISVIKIDYDMMFIGNAIGLKSAVVSVNDDGFASKLMEHTLKTQEDMV